MLGAVYWFRSTCSTFTRTVVAENNHLCQVHNFCSEITLCDSAVGNARSLGLHLDNHIRELIHGQVACLISILPWRTTGAKRVILNYYNLIIFLCDHNDATEALLVETFQASFTWVFGLLDPLSRPGIRHGFCFSKSYFFPISDGSIHMSRMSAPILQHPSTPATYRSNVFSLGWAIRLSHFI